MTSSPNPCVLEASFHRETESRVGWLTVERQRCAREKHHWVGASGSAEVGDEVPVLGQRVGLTAAPKV